jgi:hypothetical protein
MPKLNTFQSSNDTSMIALIIYDDFAFAAKANAALQRAAHQADTIVEWSVKPWRMDALRLPPAADEALTEAVNAHLIVFAGQRAEALPFWLETWLERWAANRQIEDAILALMSGGNGATLSPKLSPLLTRFAARHGLNFIIERGNEGDCGVAPCISEPTEGLAAQSGQERQRLPAQTYLTTRDRQHWRQ